MSRTRVIQMAALGLMIAALMGAGLLVGPLGRQRQALELAQAAQTQPVRMQGTASLLAQASMGAFRGLVANVLWYRANRLKSEGKFYEANQIAEWITTLQPSFASVWVFHAWNMAYNISVATYTAEERWDWVSKGIRLLRDRGIPLNPRSVSLYRELAWFFFHKIGGVADDAHWYYKRQLAIEWEEVLGPPIEGATTQQAVEAFAPIVEAPLTLGQLVVEHPQTQALLDETGRLGYDPDERLLRQIGRILMFNRSLDAQALGLSAGEQPERYDARLVDVLARADQDQALGPLLAFLRNKTLREGYHMDPAFMLELMRPEDEGGFGFGPIDWRHFASQSLYWTALGIRVADQVRGQPERVDVINTYRGTIHAFQALTDSGRISFDPVSGRLDLLPDPRFIPAYERAFELASEGLRQREFAGTPADRFGAGHENFLLKAVVFTYLYGSLEDAQRYYDRLRELYGQRPENVASGKLLQPLHDLVLLELTQNLDMMAYARQFIDAMLGQALSQGLANGRPDVFERFVEMARRTHQRAQAQATANPNHEQRRLAFLPFDEILAESYLALMQSPPASLEQMPGLVLDRSRIWRNTPIVLQQSVYDRLRPTLLLMCQSLDLDVDRAFPQPPGMEAIREDRLAEPATPAFAPGAPKRR